MPWQTPPVSSHLRFSAVHFIAPTRSPPHINTYRRRSLEPRSSPCSHGLPFPAFCDGAHRRPRQKGFEYASPLCFFSCIRFLIAKHDPPSLPRLLRILKSACGAPCSATHARACHSSAFLLYSASRRLTPHFLARSSFKSS
jgi:hypothetical protein